jgi:hypothetical protein
MSTVNQFSILSEEPEIKSAIKPIALKNAEVIQSNPLTDPEYQLNNSFEKKKHFPSITGVIDQKSKVPEVKGEWKTKTTNYSFSKTVNPNYSNDGKKEMQHQLMQPPSINQLNSSLNRFDKNRNAIIELIEQYCSNKGKTKEQVDEIIGNVYKYITDQFLQRNQAKTCICEKAEKSFDSLLKNNNIQIIKVTEFGQLHYTENSNNNTIYKKLCTNEKCTKSHNVITKQPRNRICVTNLFGCCIYGKKCNHDHNPEINLQNVDNYLPEIVFDNKEQIILSKEDDYISIFWYTDCIRIFNKVFDKTLVLTNIDILLKAIYGQSDEEMLKNKNQIKNILETYFKTMMKNENIVNHYFSQIEPKKDISITIRAFISDFMFQTYKITLTSDEPIIDYNKLLSHINKYNIMDLIYKHDTILSSFKNLFSKVGPKQINPNDVSLPWTYESESVGKEFPSVDNSRNNSQMLESSKKVDTSFIENAFKELMNQPVDTSCAPVHPFKSSISSINDKSSSLNEEFKKELANINNKIYKVDPNPDISDIKFGGKFICDKNNLIIFFENRKVFNNTFIDKIGDLDGSIKYDNLIPSFNVYKVNIFDTIIYVSSCDGLNELLHF